MAKYEDIEIPTGFKVKEYTAQCWGGPMHGEPVSASVQEWAYVERREMWLDGATGPATRVTLHGKYVLDVDLELGNRFMWNGPGADGDTMERIRKL